ncbi:MAG: hypothetical protein QG566_25, partial [Patescibacteria group bacterium]|nr:hypothetical protein [Patescibacteria group bacterium]
IKDRTVLFEPRGAWKTLLDSEFGGGNTLVSALRADHIFGSETLFENLRKRRDLNSRSSFPDAAFRERCLQPLSHVSKNIPLSYTFLQKFQKMLYYRNPNWPHRLTVRTPGFQSVNQSSILCGVT